MSSSAVIFASVRSVIGECPQTSDSSQARTATLQRITPSGGYPWAMGGIVDSALTDPLTASGGFSEQSAGRKFILHPSVCKV